MHILNFNFKCCVKNVLDDKLIPAKVVYTTSVIKNRQKCHKHPKTLGTANQNTIQYSVGQATSPSCISAYQNFTTSDKAWNSVIVLSAVIALLIAILAVRENQNQQTIKELAEQLTINTCGVFSWLL